MKNYRLFRGWEWTMVALGIGCSLALSAADWSKAPAQPRQILQSLPVTVPADCEIDTLSFGRLVANPMMTGACKQRIAQGWRLVGYSGGSFVWVR